MKAISFDIGYRNLAYCVCEVSDNRVDVVDWQVKDFGEINSVTALLPRLTTWLLDTFGDTQWDFVLIENQVGSKMRCLQTAIHVYFEMQKQMYGCGDVCSVAAALKLRDSAALPATYKNRKDYAVAYIDNKLESKPEWFIPLKKKDDLCDCLLQCIAYFQYHSFLNKEYSILVSQQCPAPQACQ